MRGIFAAALTFLRCGLLRFVEQHLRARCQRGLYLFERELWRQVCTGDGTLGQCMCTGSGSGGSGGKTGSGGTSGSGGATGAGGALGHGGSGGSTASGGASGSGGTGGQSVTGTFTVVYNNVVTRNLTHCYGCSAVVGTGGGAIYTYQMEDGLTVLSISLQSQNGGYNVQL